jgi:dTDP-4-dehydrorhamnose reductase
MKYFLVGGSGLLGSCFRRYSHKNLVVVGRSACCDIRSSIKCADSTLDKMAYGDVLIHMAWPTVLPFCESHDLSQLVHDSQLLFQKCRSRNIHFIFISTDQVYGSSDKLHSEEEVCHPLNNYGRSKLKAELSAVASGGCVVRLNYVANDSDGMNRGWVENLKHHASQDLPLDLYTNVYFSPCSGMYAVQMIEALADTSAKGIYNVGSSQKVSKAALAAAYLKKIMPSYSGFVFKKVSTYSDQVNRSLFLAMNVSKISALTGFTPETMDDVIQTLN